MPPRLPHLQMTYNVISKQNITLISMWKTGSKEGKKEEAAILESFCLLASFLFPRLERVRILSLFLIGLESNAGSTYKRPLYLCLG